MISLAPRILALPADVRAALAGVDGPGWWFSRRESTWHLCDLDIKCRDAVAWPANPAQAVAAVLYPPDSPLHAYSLYHAHELLRARLADNNDDHAAALAIIEAHVARVPRG